MKISLNWLRDYVAVGRSIHELADALTMAGLEVDSVEDRFAFLESVVAGRILEVRPHPNADKLRLCRVDIGDRVLNIVCGAPNAARGMLSACALPGAELPDGRIIEAGRIRGEPSEGMLCSEGELFPGKDLGGIMDLKPDIRPGEPLKTALGLSDPVMEIDLTPNRSDCLSFLGIAREAAAIEQASLQYPEIQAPPETENASDHASIRIDDPDLCPRYTARLVFDIKIAPSPFWLQDRLKGVGLKPINNVVDITNYVMMETGQPLHAFDYDQLAGHRIVVRRARGGERFTTLDGRERDLDEKMLLICDGEKPVALAGVMGGLNSEITDKTTRVLLESAYFTPDSIRRTSKVLGLRTDASYRFERGTDPDGTPRAADRAALLMADICGGRLTGGRLDEYPLPVVPPILVLRRADVNRVLGTDLDVETMAGLLSGIGFDVSRTDTDTLTVKVPSFRVDVLRPEDLMEEIARRWGYNNIQTTYPLIPAETRAISPGRHLRNRVRAILTGLGFTETINYSFVHAASCDRLGIPENDPRRRTVNILNPISDDQAVMRTSLMAGLLETMNRNLFRQNRRVQIFEVGKVFIHEGDDRLPAETEMLAGLWSGLRHSPGWLAKEEASVDFYDLKGALEALFHKLHLKDVVFTRLPDDACHHVRAGHAARILVNGRNMGLLGELDPRTRNHYNLRQTAFVFELDFDALLPLIGGDITVRPIPRFPSVSRDVTLIVDRNLEGYGLIASIREADEPLVEDVFIFDVYTGEPIPPGRKSISFRIVYRSPDATLDDESVNAVHTRLTETLVRAFDAALP